ncbi:hypothetical protein BMF89_08355 [Arthrobacter sp. SRS-W-1-2016]|uniref:hypothetical protein n=1 Tax=Arthrobacter sp. SRS-W-1-2016 TaxID=1930254 RepID=UPI00099140D0|nr:hypothetical protein [Arthrobacter sp. SRS-W-1-2016]OOP62737.1 hypothetical protein BMF89_08355 [Arthrobacter sp. SRS-W-1-2016]
MPRAPGARPQQPCTAPQARRDGRYAAATAHAEEITQLDAQRAAQERQLAAIGKQLEESREAERAAAKEAAEAARRLATNEVRATTLEQVHNALLQRVSPDGDKGCGGVSKSKPESFSPS